MRAGQEARLSREECACHASHTHVVVLLLINIHEIITLPFSACIHCEPKRTKSSKKQHQLHVLAALVSTLAHTVHEGESWVYLHELRRQFSSPENALCRVYQHLWRVQSVFEGGSKRSGVYMPLLASVSHNQASRLSMPYLPNCRSNYQNLFEPANRPRLGARLGPAPGRAPALGLA